MDGQAARGDALAVLDPQLAAVGFGLFCELDDCAGVIVYKHGLTKSQFLGLYEGNAMDWNGTLGTMPFTTARLRKPIEFPPTRLSFPSAPIEAVSTRTRWSVATDTRHPAGC